MAWEAVSDWKGETAFIIAGGPSVADQNLGLLRGRKVVVINSSVHVYPMADILIFGDLRWFREKENFRAVKSFRGTVITPCEHVRDSQVKVMHKALPPGPVTNRNALMFRRTTLSAAINLLMHKGVSRIVLLGADGKARKDAKGQLVTHHHKPHKWPSKPGCWLRQRDELQTMVRPLKKAGVEVLNASPGSAWDLWPIVTLESVFECDIPKSYPKMPHSASYSLAAQSPATATANSG